MTTPELICSGGAVAFTWKLWALTVTLSRFKDKSSGPTCEMRATIAQQDKVSTLTSGTLNLSSLQGRDRLAKRLKELYQLPDWNLVIELICVRGLNEFRRGEPTTYLEGLVTHTVEEFVLNPLLYARHPTLLYGPGDSGKSFFCLYCACLLSVGGSQNGLCCSDFPVLYLDWELAKEDMDTRVSMIKAGHPELRGARIAYKRPVAPLTECLDEIRAAILETGARILILDSLALAAGGELEKAETAIRFNQALRLLGLPSLIVGHTAKNTEEKTIYGSVFFYNLARSVFEIKKTQEPDSGVFTFGLYHKKCNLGPKKSPLGFQVAIDNGVCCVTEADLSEEPELCKSLPVSMQIAGILKSGKAMSAQSISNDTTIKLDTVRRVLQRGKGKKWLQLTGKPGEEAQWASL
jgi:hypothetical protein